MSSYAFHPDALSDLEEIWDFIAEDNLDAADRVIDDVHRALALLARLPNQGHRRLDLTSKPLRFWQVHNYLIAYAHDRLSLTVIAVVHGRRSPRLMAAMLAKRM